MSLWPSEREQMRKDGYKQMVDAEESRRRREGQMVDIREAKREESLQKKRGLNVLPAMVQAVLSNDPTMQLEATMQFRKPLSIERSPPIQEVMRTGVVPRSIEFLERVDHPQLQFEAAWALTNIVIANQL